MKQIGKLLTLALALSVLAIIISVGSVRVFADTGLTYGGADAVTAGRPLMQPLKEKGPEGVRETIVTMTKQLQSMMYRTGTCDLKHMDPSVIWEK